MWTRSELKAAAKDLLSRDYWMCVVAAFICGIVTGAGNGGSNSGRSFGRLFSEENIEAMDPQLVIILATIFILITLFVMLIVFIVKTFLLAPLQVGCYRFFISCREGNAIMDMVIFVFKEGKNTYFNVVKIMFWKQLKLFLWTLLFIIPGIIKSYEYCMIPYILADNPDIDMDTAFEMSRSMTDGNKWNIFVLGLSFIGWIILGVLTLGLGLIFYVNPYMQLTNAELYHTLAEQNNFTGTYNTDNETDFLEEVPL